MSDSAINKFLASGPTADRVAFVPDPPTVATGADCGYLWWDTDLQAEYAYDFGTAAWVAVAGGSGTVTNTGTLTDHALIVGNGGVDVSALPSLGTTTTVLHGNAAGDPTFGAVALATDVSGDLPLANLAQASAASKLLGRGSASGGGDYEEITIGTGLTMTATTLSASGGSSVVVQIVTTETGAVATGTTQIPFDDTIPQNTEGDEYMTLAITPTSSTHKLAIEVVLFGTVNTSSWLSVALFQDATASALAAFANYQTISTAGNSTVLRHIMTAGTTSSTTFKVRAGTNAGGTVTFNGQSSGRIFGGVMASSITITEYVP